MAAQAGKRGEAFGEKNKGNRSYYELLTKEIHLLDRPLNLSQSALVYKT